MDPRIEHFFSPVKLVQLKTDLNTPFVPYDREKGWEYNQKHYESREKPVFARQALKVYDKREALAKISLMLQELKNMGIQEKLDEIRTFARDNEIDCMLDFCSWGDAFDDMNTMLESDPVGSAINWMASTQDC